MAFDQGLAQRMREQLADTGGVTEKQMFGGLAFLVDGNMACGVRGEDLIVRLAPDASESVQDKPGVRPFDLTGRPMKGWLMVAPDGHADDDDLRRWVDRGVAHAASLPPKGP
jgi:TfoX/Sxy family transcriptional regulator of competence genes